MMALNFTSGNRDICMIKRIKIKKKNRTASAEIGHLRTLLSLLKLAVGGHCCHSSEILEKCVWRLAEL